MKIRNVFYSILAVALVWSCGKDEAVKAPVNNAPVIADQVFKVLETITESDIIGKVVAVDADKDALTFSITTNDKELFSITKDGALSLATGKTLDFDKATSHKITVKVSDGTKDASAKITINVSEDSEEEEEEEATNEAPVFDEDNFVFEVSEDIADTDAIGTLTATDIDGDDLTYSLVTDESELFVLSEAGELTLAEGKALDYETATEYALEVSVTDGELEAMANVTITVLNVIESMFEDPASFITTWKTEADGDEIEIGISVDNHDYNFTIDWGDGTVEELTDADGNPTHEYAKAGTYKVAIQGEFPRFNTSLNSKKYLIGLDQWGHIEWESCYATFYECEYMTYNAKDTPDFSKVIDMGYMFYGTDFFNGDISDWDTGNVVNMEYMFYNASSFNGDISGWDTSNVTDMAFMFAFANSFNGDISGWDTRNVTDMAFMFFKTAAFDQNLDKWDVGNVTNMTNTFEYSGMSALNFSNTLIGWAKLELQPNVELGASSVDICATAEAVNAIITLENITNNWVILYKDAVGCD